MFLSSRLSSTSTLSGRKMITSLPLDIMQKDKITKNTGHQYGKILLNIAKVEGATAADLQHKHFSLFLVTYHSIGRAKLPRKALRKQFCCEESLRKTKKVTELIIK